MWVGAALAYVGNRAAFGFDAAKAGGMVNYVRPVLHLAFCLQSLALWLISLASSVLFAGGIAAGLISIWLYLLLGLADLSGQGLLA